jgi:hypothetical protein
VSEITERLWAEYEDFCKRDLNGTTQQDAAVSPIRMPPTESSAMPFADGGLFFLALDGALISSRTVISTPYNLA